MQKIICLSLLFVIVISFASCGEKPVDNRIKVPDVVDTDEKTAKSILSSSGLIPSIKYDYDDDIKKGNVVKTEPKVSSKVEKNSKITVYISKGKSYVESKDSRIEWTNVSNKDDDWEFYSPYIKKDTLYIKCNVKFACPIKWKDTYKEGYIIGDASINDSFDKTVPISAKYKKQSWKAYEKQNFTLEIPLKDLSESRPTDMYTRLYTTKKGEVDVNFYITW